MVPTNLFKGKIKIKNGKKVVKSISFKFSVSDFSIEKIMMANFSDITFAECEKRELSAHHREIIKQYQSLSDKEIKKFSKELSNALKSVKSDTLKIEACDAGTFICIAAIFSGSLPKNKEFFFHLSCAPISLFPKELVKNKSAGHSVNVNLYNDCNSWLRPYKSLQQEPEYIEFTNGSSFDDQLLAS